MQAFCNVSVTAFGNDCSCSDDLSTIDVLIIPQLFLTPQLVTSHYFTSFIVNLTVAVKLSTSYATPYRTQRCGAVEEVDGVRPEGGWHLYVRHVTFDQSFGSLQQTPYFVETNPVVAGVFCDQRLAGGGGGR